MRMRDAAATLSRSRKLPACGLGRRLRSSPQAGSLRLRGRIGAHEDLEAGCPIRVHDLRLRRPFRASRRVLRMPHRFLCLQGHLWAYTEDAARTARPLFCPTCGLRLHPESDVPQVSLPRLHVPPDATPIFSTGSIHLSRAPGDAAPAVAASEIEEIPGY